MLLIITAMQSGVALLYQAQALYQGLYLSLIAAKIAYQGW